MNINHVVLSGRVGADPELIGIPQWLARLEDCIFEGLSHDRSQKWPEEFLEAITPGIDLNTIERNNNYGDDSFCLHA